MNFSEFERHLSAYIDDELTAEMRLEMEAFMDADETARAEFENHLSAWEAAQDSRVNYVSCDQDKRGSLGCRPNGTSCDSGLEVNRHDTCDEPDNDIPLISAA